MAAYGKDDFIFGSEFDDFSDTEDNLDLLDATEEEDDEPVYCLCGEANDDEMIMCEAEECVGCIWYHYKCAGFADGNVPEGVWTCIACNAEEGSATQAQQPLINQVPEVLLPAAETTAAPLTGEASAVKPTARQRKKRLVHPTSVYKRQNANDDGPRHLKAALNMVADDPVFKLSDCGRFILLIVQAVLLIPPNALQTLVEDVSTKLLECAGPHATITSQDREKLWQRFHLYSIQESVRALWESLFTTLTLKRDSQAETIFIQAILTRWFSILIIDRNNTDFPPVPVDVTCDPMSEKEQSIIHYVAGFIAFKLKGFYARFPGNKTAQHIVQTVQKWRVPQGGDSTSFLAYATKWINAVDRGGLFRVSDTVFCFFRQLEQKSRPYVNKTYINSHHNVDLRNVLASVLLNSAPITTAWKGITSNLNGQDLRETLLIKTVHIYINIRLRAYVKAVCYLNRERVSKKKQKALRKDLVEKA